MANPSCERRTLWSETLLEMLKYALRTQRGDGEVRQILGELLGKGYEANELVLTMERELGAGGAVRLQRLL